MRLRAFIWLVALAAVLALPLTVSARGPSPAQLTKAGWTCILPPPDFNPNVHCLPANQLAGVISGEAEVVISLAFATDDLGATQATPRHRADDPGGHLRRPAVPDGPAVARLLVAVPTLRVGLLHLPHVRQSVVNFVFVVQTAAP